MLLENTDWLLPSLTLKIALILIVVGAATRSKAQTSNVSPVDKAEATTPLQRGAAVPDMLWGTPLTLWNAADNRTEAITLNDYRGKVIILDFWATWCKSCISNMPRMLELERQFGDDIVIVPVTYENQSTVQAFFARSTSSTVLEIKDDFRSVLSDTVFKQKLFPNPTNTIPYFAIIGKEGTYRGITIPKYLNEQLVSNLVEGKPGFMPELFEVPEMPLLAPATNVAPLFENNAVYYTLLTNYIHGYNEGVEREVDSLKETYREYYINQPLIRLYSYALGTVLPRQANRRILLVEAAERYDYNKQRNPSYNPFDYNFTYEFIAPMGISPELARQNMLSTLNSLSGLHGELITREVNCLVLRRQADVDGISPITGAGKRQFDMKAITWQLNRPHRETLPPVIDESDYKGKIWMNGSAMEGDVEATRTILKAQGLDLVEETRELEIFVLRPADADDAILNSPLELTSYGYVRKEGNHE